MSYNITKCNKNYHVFVKHRVTILKIENKIAVLRLNNSQDEDVPLWKQREGKFDSRFSTKKTWLQLRHKQSCSWSKGIWFPSQHRIYSFLLWVALRNRLQTCDRMHIWNNAVNQICILCNEADETRHHLFFSCRYTKQIWRALVGGISQVSFTSDWNEIIGMISNPTITPTKTFLLRYTFQATIHSIWRERIADTVNSRNIQAVSSSLWTRRSGLDCYQLKDCDINIWKKDWSLGLGLVKTIPKHMKNHKFSRLL